MQPLRQQWYAGSYVNDDGGAWCQAPRLKLGWQLWLGAHWVAITSLRVVGKDVLIGADDGRAPTEPGISTLCAAG